MGGMAVIVNSSLFFAAEIIGTVAFAVSGALVGLHYKLDLFGILLLAVTTALGGGVIRDVLIGRIPPVMFRDYRYLTAAVVTAFVVFLTAHFAHQRFVRHEEKLVALNNIFDAVGLGAFAVVGMEAGIGAGYGDNGFFLVFLALLTCIGGGILRDIFVMQTPRVLRKHVYALPCILGACLYLAMTRRQVLHLPATLVTMGFIFVLRMLATKYRWNLPRA